jgi:hypothetical protein
MYLTVLRRIVWLWLAAVQLGPRGLAARIEYSHPAISTRSPVRVGGRCLGQT